MRLGSVQQDLSRTWVRDKMKKVPFSDMHRKTNRCLPTIMERNKMNNITRIKKKRQNEGVTYHQVVWFSIPSIALRPQ